MDRKIGIGAMAGIVFILMWGRWYAEPYIMESTFRCTETLKSLIDYKERKVLRSLDRVLLLQKMERGRCPNEERSESLLERLEGTQNIVFDGTNVNYYTPEEYKARKDELIPMVRTRLNAGNNRMDSKEDAYEAIHIATLEAINGNITTLTGKITLKNLVNLLE